MIPQKLAAVVVAPVEALAGQAPVAVQGAALPARPRARCLPKRVGPSLLTRRRRHVRCPARSPSPPGLATLPRCQGCCCLQVCVSVFAFCQCTRALHLWRFPSVWPERGHHISTLKKIATGEVKKTATGEARMLILCVFGHSRPECAYMQGIGDGLAWLLLYCPSFLCALPQCQGCCCLQRCGSLSVYAFASAYVPAGIQGLRAPTCKA